MAPPPSLKGVHGGRLEFYNNNPIWFTPGVWRHKWNPVTFTLIVDDFGIRFVGEEHAYHLKNTFKEFYDITIDLEGSKNVGMDLK